MNRVNMATVASNYNPREIDNTADVPGRRAQLVTGNQTYSSITDMVCRVAEDPQPLLWYVLFGPVLVSNAVSLSHSACPPIA